MASLTLVVNHEDDRDALEYLIAHYHDYTPEEWEAQYEQLTEIAVLEDQIRERKQQLIRKCTALIDE